MAVIRTVSSVTHYEMDVSEQELLCILITLRYRLKGVGDSDCLYKAETTQLITLIEGRLRHG